MKHPQLKYCSCIKICTPNRIYQLYTSDICTSVKQSSIKGPPPNGYTANKTPTNQTPLYTDCG